MNCTELCGALQNLAHDGHALKEVDEINGLEVTGARVENGKIVLLTRPKETEPEGRNAV